MKKAIIFLIMDKVIRYFQIPQFLFRLPLSYKEKMIISILYDFQRTNKVKPTQGLLNYMLGNDEDDKNIRKTIRELEEKEWIRVDREYGRTNIYHLNREKIDRYITAKDYVSINGEGKTPCNTPSREVSYEKAENIEGTQPTINWGKVMEKLGYSIDGFNKATDFMTSDIMGYIKDNYGIEKDEDINNDFNVYKVWQKRKRMTA